MLSHFPDVLTKAESLEPDFYFAGQEVVEVILSRGWDVLIIRSWGSNGGVPGVAWILFELVRL